MNTTVHTTHRISLNFLQTLHVILVFVFVSRESLRLVDARQSALWQLIRAVRE